MIQRIQSVLLFLAFIFDGTIFFNALYRQAMNDPQGWVDITFAIILTIAALGSLGCIFLYSNRSNQKKWVGMTMLVQIVALGIGLGIYVSLGGFGMFLWDETIGLGFLLAALLFQLYARKKIQDDIELVKSMDRIR